MTLNEIGAAAKQASVLMNRMTVTEKNKGLSAVAKALTAKTEYILAANDQDIEEAKKNHMSEALLDRLRLTEDRIGGIAAAPISFRNGRGNPSGRCLDRSGRRSDFHENDTERTADRPETCADGSHRNHL